MAQYTPTTASVAASISAVTLFASGTGQDTVGRTVFNDSGADLYLKLGASASTTDFTVKIPAGGYYELTAPVFDGLVTGIWSAATGSARCTQVDL